MPANNGIRPNDGERLAGLRKQLADPTQNHPVDGQKWHPTGPTSSQHDDLLPQHEDLGFQRRARSEQIDDNPKNYSAEIRHPAEDHPILRLTPTGWNLRQGQVLFSHPKDFTPVCTTELGYMAKIKSEFDKRGVKIIGLSVDPLDRHVGWAADIKETQGFAPNYPMIADVDYNVSKLYMLPAPVSGDPTKRTPADNQTVRNVFVIGPDKKIKLTLVYPMSNGRNFDEVLPVIDSLQLTAKFSVATPVNWKSGEDVIIGGSVSDEDAKKKFPQGWKAPKPYIRIVPQPGPAA